MFMTVLAAPVNHKHQDSTVFPDQKVRNAHQPPCVHLMRSCNKMTTFLLQRGKCLLCRPFR